MHQHPGPIALMEPPASPAAISSVSLLMDMSSMDRLERIADLMASGKTTIPQHLRGSKGDCFAIAMQSMQWGMNPFAVAQKTHLVNGVLGYEAQLVAAVINNSGIVSDRFNFEWFGPWEKIVGKFKQVESRNKTDDDGKPKKFIVPDWHPDDERGLGVKVWATLRGEDKPREITLLMTQARTRNSTLWTEDPKQQLAYLAQKRWARLYAPDVILGVYSPDEFEGDRPPVHMGPADVVGAPPAPAAPVTYPEAEFEQMLPTWTDLFAAGRATADKLLAKMRTKGEVSADQEKRLRDAEAKAKTIDQAPPPPPAPPAPPASEHDDFRADMDAAEAHFLGDRN